MALCKVVSLWCEGVSLLVHPVLHYICLQFLLSCSLFCFYYNVYGHSGLVFKYAFLVPVMCLVYVMALEFLGATEVSRDGGSSWKHISHCPHSHKCNRGCQVS